ncbi:MAG: heme synthase, cytochrome oxidase biosis protein [Ferruginibacter sp.]|nr:heme synthase, cytochrome oxidase biosis protein [Ferruginibacter sp.]
MRVIKNWILATFILSFLVIIAGGIVRTTQSGMGCPDWPRCFGKWIPPTNASELPADFEKYLGKQDIDHSFNAYHTWIEYFNRLLGVLLGLFAIIQVALIYKKRKQLTRPFKLALAFLITVILTGLFGAIVVKLNLAHVSISVHLLFALLLTQIQLALWLDIRDKIQVLPAAASLRKWTIIFLLLIFIQSVLGTMVRMYIDDISRALNYQQRDTWLADSPTAFLIHRSFSWVVLIIGLFLAWKSNNVPALKNKYFLLAAVLLTSMITGVGLFYAGMPALAQPLHLLLASLGITQTVSILLQLRATGSNRALS